MARWSCPVLLIGLLFASARAGSKVAGAGPSSTILANESSATSSHSTSASASLSTSSRSWNGHAHLDYTVPLQDPCKGTADFDLTLSVASDGHISGSGTGGYSDYTCTTRLGTVTAPGASADYRATGTGNADHLVFLIAPDPPGAGLPPAWPTPTAGSFDVPITGSQASAVVHSQESLGLLPGLLTLTLSLTCTDCG